MVFRPLWTYYNEERIKESVVLYFYSTNQNPLLIDTEKEKLFEVYGYKLHSWNKYICWSEHHEEWLNKLTNKKNKFIRTPFIPFAGKHIKLNNKKKILSIFDVPPRTDEIYRLLDNPYNIYTLDYCTKFLDDIFKVFPKSFYNEFNIIIKSKFKNENIIHKKYIQYLKNLENKNITIINNISAESIIENSHSVISIPFTSPAITSLRKNKNTVYYDPSGKLTMKNCLEKEIKLISSLDDLKIWIGKLNEN